MIIKLMDYKCNKHSVDIPDDTEYITIKVVTGDMIMTSPRLFDTDIYHNRLIDHYDGKITINRKDFNQLNSIENSYEILKLNNN